MRSLADFQIVSHIPFVFVFFLSIYMNFYEMTLLVGLVVFFSVLYHLGEEERNVFSYIDNVTSCSLSMYGNVQLFYSPSAFILCTNLSLAMTALFFFALGYRRDCEEYYYMLHPIALHIVPSIWSGIVVVFQTPFFF